MAKSEPRTAFALSQSVKFVRIDGPLPPMETRFMEYRLADGSASVRLDVEGPDEFAPLLRFVGDELAKVGWRVCEHVATQVRKPSLQFGIGEARIDLLVEFVDDLGGRVLGRADAEPSACLVARDEFAHRRDIRQRGRAIRRGHRQRAQLAGTDMFDRGGHIVEQDLNLSTDEIGDRWCRAAI